MEPPRAARVPAEPGSAKGRRDDVVDDRVEEMVTRRNMWARVRISRSFKRSAGMNQSM